MIAKTTIDKLDLTTPKFKEEWELTEEQLTDPDYRIKQLAKMAGIDSHKLMNCSKCHHCR